MLRSCRKVELVCPAGNPASLRAALDNGADVVYVGLRNSTNARNFPGLNFSMDEINKGLNYTRQKGGRLFLAINTYPTPDAWKDAVAAINMAAETGIDALIMADAGLMNYTSRMYPDMPIHLSVQGSATNRHAIAFYHEQFGIRRVVLPRVLSLSQVRNIIDQTSVEVEVFAYGSLCVMVEGRCALSSFVTGDSPNSAGVCSPAHAVRWTETPSGVQSYLNNVLINCYAPDEKTSYPTICKGRYRVNEQVFYAIEEPASLSVLDILPDLVKAGTAAIKIEGRQRSTAYVSRVTRIMRSALDACEKDSENFRPDERWKEELLMLSEGGCHTLGAYHRPWQ